jgi:hypothetical protein
VAIICPEPKRGRHSQLRGGTGDVSKQRLSIARAVLAYSRETGGKLHREVMRGPANGGRTLGAT